jgi:protein translocase SecG subunit
MQNILMTIETVIAILMSLCILLQHRASGLSATFGGSGATYVQRRGAEKALFVFTIWLSVAFFAIALALMYLG